MVASQTQSAPSPLELHVISNGTGDLDVFLEKAIRVSPWVDYIHIREKHLAINQRLHWAERMQEVGIPASQIVINGIPDRMDGFSVPKLCGVHRGEADFKQYGTTIRMDNKDDPIRLGVSVHSLEGAKSAEHQGANYVIFGHVFATNSKSGIAPRGIPALKAICSSLCIPVIAIGGIRPDCMDAIYAAGASGIAVMSAIWENSKPEQAAAAFKQAMSDVRIMNGAIENEDEGGAIVV